ncbi:GLPGLI family protein [Sphingobacterium sp. SRCM116780]|uniref:GLPGLI family protein n=1 Tax=Sphingobacterium sp. SRCM116780 TaxID=2907623 RepID=UPI001F3B6013|nr:GLPGLI family protein [Sphingobacterium sp. SRCM116780]UIR57623.1 GLPGLI family protein [Sphingobacterium sp. SRCM116780]
MNHLFQGIRILYVILFLTLTQSLFAQKGILVEYQRSNNNKIMEAQDPILVYASDSQTTITSRKIMNGERKTPYEVLFIKRPTNSYYKLTNLDAQKQLATLDSTVINKQQFEITKERKKILGYTCYRAKTSINSNSIDVWYTTELNLKGGPSELGQNLGFVLEVVRNGNSAITASKIEQVKSFPSSVSLPSTLDLVDDLTYKDLLWKSRFIQIPIFNKQKISFSDNSKSDSILRFASGTVIVKKVKIPKITAGQDVFIQVTEQSKGDAYDRTGSVFIIPEDQGISFLDGMKNGMNTLPIYNNGNGKDYQGVIRTANYTPILELMRFFTPFGVSQFNYLKLKDKNWQDSVLYRQDIGELASAISDKDVYVGAFIGNYDKNGHEVSVEITIHPGSDNHKSLKKLLPIFNSTNVMEMGGQEYGTMFNKEKGLEVTFELKEEAKNVQLRYITTGHGGWGDGDEFVPKTNSIYLNDQLAFSYTPWRNDCGSYRLSNPASGNFANGLSSSDLSRSNWCPGTVTYPIYIDLGVLKAGKHTIRVQIPQGENEGTSFSSWNVSGVLLYD